jgi:hypothetical protein
MNTPTVAQIRKMTLADIEAITTLDMKDWTPEQRAAAYRRINKLVDAEFAPSPERMIEDALRAIRSDKVVGRYTCSMVDEAMTDDEVVAEFVIGTDGKPCTVRGAVRKARAAHRLWADCFNERYAECW